MSRKTFKSHGIVTVACNISACLCAAEEAGSGVLRRVRIWLTLLFTKLGGPSYGQLAYDFETG
jgi:hypothetical protein